MGIMTITPNAARPSRMRPSATTMTSRMQAHSSPPPLQSQEQPLQQLSQPLLQSQPLQQSTQLQPPQLPPQLPHAELVRQQWQLLSRLEQQSFRARGLQTLQGSEGEGYLGERAGDGMWRECSTCPPSGRCVWGGQELQLPAGISVLQSWLAMRGCLGPLEKQLQPLNPLPDPYICSELTLSCCAHHLLGSCPVWHSFNVTQLGSPRPPTRTSCPQPAG